MLKKVKNKIENEFTETVDNHIKEQVNEIKKSKPKKIVVKKDKKSDSKFLENKEISRKTSRKTVAKK